MGWQGGGQIDDWELWGDPKEIERRKAERARAAMHPEARKEQVAEEWATARGEAARAKAAGDKARQKAAGQVIAGLKKEIAQLGTHPIMPAGGTGQSKCFQTSARLYESLMSSPQKKLSSESHAHCFMLRHQVGCSALSIWDWHQGAFYAVQGSQRQP